MGKTISRKAWQRATNALLWYPDNKREQATITEELMTNNPEHGGSVSQPLHHDPTADAGMRLAMDRRLQTLRQEIEAVETALQSLRPEEIWVVRRRYFDSYKYVRQRRIPLKYEYLLDAGYSVRSMKRISKRTIFLVAEYLGEA